VTLLRQAVRSALALFACVAAASATAAAEVVPVSAEVTSASDPRDILVMLRLSPDHYRPGASYAGSYGDRATSSMRRRLARRIAHRHGLDLAEPGWPMPLVGLDCYVMRVPGTGEVGKAIREVTRDPLVAWSQPIRLYRTQGRAAATAGDPLLPVQPAAAAWRLSELHRTATGRGVVVAVVDSKIELTHPDLAGQFVARQDFVGEHPGLAERHGTAVAGVIAAKENNGAGIAGVSPGARLMALRACWQSDAAPAAPTLCNTLSLAKAIHYAVEHNADIINLSLAGPPDLLLAQLVQVALARRISVVAAFDPDLPQGGFPASEPRVIAVASDELRFFPPGVYGAPGRDIPTTQPGGTWYLVNGSSYAAAHVSGLLALLRERAEPPRPTLPAAQPLGGRIDACATLSRLFTGLGCSATTVAQAAAARP
jgi:subtilisin family serine protease